MKPRIVIEPDYRDVWWWIVFTPNGQKLPLAAVARMPLVEAIATAMEMYRDCLV